MNQDTPETQTALASLVERWASVPVSPYYGYGRVKLYGPQGMQVEIPLSGDPVTFWSQCEALLAQGWKVTAPGLEEGETKEEIGWCLRTDFEREGATTPTVLLYANDERMTWPILKVYLNSPTDQAAFEHASGMTISKMPDYVGNDKPQRGASPKTDLFICRAARPFGMVYKKNPKHDPTETDPKKKKPARLFVRWADQKTQTTQTPAQAEKPAPQGNGATANLTPEVAELILQWTNAIAHLHDTAMQSGVHETTIVNKWIEDDWDATPQAAKQAIWKMIAELSNRKGWRRDEGTRVFYVPGQSPADMPF